MTNRRQFLGKLGVGATSFALLSGVSGCRQPSPNVSKANDTQDIMASPQTTHEFYGEHQSGIMTPAQHHVYFLVAELATQDKQAVQQMFKNWTQAAARLMKGENIADYGTNPHLPPADTGEADSLSAYGLTLTFGVSASFFEKLGLNDKKPSALKPLPHFPRDQIRSTLSGGDICIQACSDDPQVAFHAVRQLVRQARALITMRWSQSGYNSFDDVKHTPRNLFGFKDGTANQDALADANRWVWADDAGWFAGGTYLVARVIKMHLETWDRTSLEAQEDTFGRHRASGAAIGKQGEFDEFDAHEKDADGNLVIADATHVGIAKRTEQKMLRRSFSYSSGIDERTGQFDAGLMFISFQKDPQQFIDIQNAFGNNDKMTEYTTHIGSGLFACFGGVQEGSYLGQALFE